MIIEKENAQNNVEKIELIKKTCTDKKLKREINYFYSSELSFLLYIFIEFIILASLLKLSFYFIVFNHHFNNSKILFLISIIVLLIFLIDFILFLIDIKAPISMFIKKCCNGLDKRRSLNKSLERHIKQRYRICISEKDYDLIKRYYLDKNYNIVKGIDLLEFNNKKIIFNKNNFKPMTRYDNNYCEIIDKIQLGLNL